MNIVLIYEMIPESTSIYLLENLVLEDYLQVIKNHAKYVNSEPEDVNWLSNFLKDKVPAFDDTATVLSMLQVQGHWKIVHSGFVL